MPRFDCTERCQAPDAFFSGSPYLSNPEGGRLELKEDTSYTVEWQIWTSVNKTNDLNLLINDKSIDIMSVQVVLGLTFELKSIQFFGKFLKIQAEIKMEMDPPARNWTILLSNQKNGMCEN